MLFSLIYIKFPLRNLVQIKDQYQKTLNKNLGYEKM
jgi:hypothetical protein